ncbi:hypothetical protein PPTG_24524 [Phytophthora nicotianae INRA-310]|uniref:Uncharacterized protein n=1 Tax=Phytophthora nicotianae (strain INRA-310) TaxID=761204 RepID=W2PFW7_PHYN3|nr:hypothetical protein PPTG_24524 [Phytophthora nicotianae INRA-310]ETM98899.1 hypothetical protein PPTG_24524 [Phytophthora nicotianae INRA-310]
MHDKRPQEELMIDFTAHVDVPERNTSQPRDVGAHVQELGRDDTNEHIDLTEDSAVASSGQFPR